MTVAERLGLDKSSASRRCRQAAAAGYLKNLETRRGFPAQLVMGEPMPAEREVFPAPERLRGCTANGGITVEQERLHGCAVDGRDRDNGDV